MQFSVYPFVAHGSCVIHLVVCSKSDIVFSSHHHKIIPNIVPGKVEYIFKGSLDSISSLSVKIQISGGKVCLKCKCKTLLGVVDKLLKTKFLLTSPSNVLPYYLM